MILTSPIVSRVRKNLHSNLDFAFILRSVTIATGFASTLISSKIILALYGLHGMQFYAIWLALSAFGGLVELGKSSTQMDIINNPVYENRTRAMLLTSLYKKVFMGAFTISIFAFLVLQWQLSAHYWFTLSIVTTSAISLTSLFVLKEKIAEGHQSKFIIVSSISQLTTPLVLGTGIIFNQTLETALALTFIASCIPVSIFASRIYLNRKIESKNLSSTDLEDAFYGVRDFPTRSFLSITVGLGLLGGWDRLWASQLLSPIDFAQFAITQTILLSILNLLSLNYQKLWRRKARHELINFSDEMKSGFSAGILLSFGAMLAIKLANSFLFSSYPLDSKTLMICSVIILTTSVQNVLSALISDAHGFRYQGCIVTCAVLFRFILFTVLLHFSAPTPSILLLSTAITLLFVQVPFTYQEVRKTGK